MVAAPASVVWVVVSTGGEDSVEQVLTMINIADFCQNEIKLTGYLRLRVLINANVLIFIVKDVMKGMMMTLILLAQPDMI